MSLTLIAMTGILVGFLCLVIGFLMEDTQDHNVVHPIPKGKRVKASKKKAVVLKKKAA